MNSKECLELIESAFDKRLKDGLLNLQVKWLIDQARKTERYGNALEQMVNVLDGQKVTPLVEQLAFVLSDSGIYERRKWNMGKKCPNCGTLHNGMFPHCYICFDCPTYYEYEERGKLNMTHSKLDVYDYLVLPGVIRIGISGVSDPILVDILSEIELVGGRVYVDGVHYQYLNQYEIIISGDGSYIDLMVVPAN